MINENRAVKPACGSHFKAACCPMPPIFWKACRPFGEWLLEEQRAFTRLPVKLPLTAGGSADLQA